VLAGCEKCIIVKTVKNKGEIMIPCEKLFGDNKHIVLLGDEQIYTVD
jgi:hypothetical protein